MAEEDKKKEEKKQEGKAGEEEKKEEEEEEEEEELRKVGASLVTEANKKITFYQPPKPFVKKEMLKQEKAYNEIMRRWRVTISQIEIENLDVIYHSPFMQIIIGGDYRIEFGKNAGLQTKFAKFEGELGLMFKTEVIMNLEPRNPQRFKTEIQTEYRGSYFDIKRQHIYFEVWGWNGLQLNVFYNIKALELEEIVQSQDLHFQMIFQREMKGGRKVNTMRVRLKMSFEQIWDYVFYFMDWRTSQLLLRDTRNVSLEIKVTGSSRKVVSKKENGPILVWPNLRGQIVIRSTALQLSSKLLILTLKRGGRTLGFQTIPLRTLLENSQISTTVTCKEPGGNEHGILVNLQGMSVLHSKPRWLQGGHSVQVYEKNTYLVCQVRSADVKDALEDMGLAEYFTQIAWGGVLQKTRLHRREQVNETFYFEIPLDDQTRNDRQKMEDVLKEKLRAESKLKIYLWAYDPVKQTNVNLGNGVIELAQIINYGEDTKKKFRDKDTKKLITFNTRNLNATLQMRSPDTSLHCSMNISLWFQKDIPLLDMPYDNTTGVEVPIEIRRKLNILNIAWKAQLDHYVWQYQDEPKDNYEVYKIDQFADPHFICSFLGKITLPLTSQDLKPNGKNDFGYVHNPVKLQTMMEVAHWVKCIPYVLDKFANAWKTPPFLAQLKRGDEFDHSVMLVSLFMGVKYETELDWQIQRLKMVRKIKNSKKNKGAKVFTQAELVTKFPQYGDMIDVKVPLAKRVFVCIGRLHKSDRPHAWVMSIDKDMTTVIFWEAKSGKKYELKGRIQLQERRGLVDFLNGDVKLKWKEKKEKRQDSYDSLIEGEQDLLEEDKASEPEEDDSSDMDLTVEDNEQFNSMEDNIPGLDLDLNKLIKEDGQDVRLEHGMGTGFTRGMDFEAKDKLYKITTGLARKQEMNEQALKFLQKQKQKFQDEEKRRPDRHLEPVLEFMNVDGVVENQPDLPYRTIDIIFNRTNVWANMGNRNPLHINFHLHKPGRWLPLVYIQNEEDLRPPDSQEDAPTKGKKGKKNKKTKKGKQTQKESKPLKKGITRGATKLKEEPIHQTEVSIHLSQDQDDNEAEEDNIDSKFPPNLWTKQFTPFFEPPTIPPAFTAQKAKQILDKILREIKLAIILSQPDPINRWKPPNGKLCKVYQRILVLKEHLQCGRIGKADYKQRMRVATNDLKSIMPVDFEVRSLPMFYNMIDAEFIKSYAIDRLVPRFINADRIPLKKSVFALTGVIFPYHGQVCSIRVMLAVFYASADIKQNKELTAPMPSNTRRSMQPGLSAIKKSAVSQRARSVPASVRGSAKSNRSGAV